MVSLLAVNTITSVLVITLNVKTHIFVKINIFEHLKRAYRTSDNTFSYRPIHVLARRHVQYQHSNVKTETFL